MKKLSILLALVFALTSIVTCFAAEGNVMTDVDYSTDLGKSIEKLINAGVVNGIPQKDGTFKYEPSQSITRAEFCKMVNETFGFKVMANNVFTDVSKDKWYYIHILPAIHEGYIQGYGNGKFGPEDNITREQVCVILSRIIAKREEEAKKNGETVAEVPKTEIKIKDNVSDWAKEYVENIIARGYIALEDGDTFRATKNMTRGEFASAIDDFVVVAEAGSDEKTENVNKTETSDDNDGAIGVKGTVIGGSSGGSSSGGSSSGGSSSGSSSSGSSSSGSSSSGSSSSGSSSSGSSSSGSSSSGNSSSGNTTPSTPEPEPEPEPETEYSITYELNGIGELPDTANTSYFASKGASVPKLSSTTDYIFEGWYKDASFADETKVSSIAKGTTGDITLYAKWRERYTQEERETSDSIYSALESVLNDINQILELDLFDFDEKGQEIFDLLTQCSNEVYEGRDTGAVISNNSIRTKYSKEISRITNILDGMSTEERASFEDQLTWLNVATLETLVDIFDVNINYGK